MQYLAGDLKCSVYVLSVLRLWMMRWTTNRWPFFAGQIFSILLGSLAWRIVAVVGVVVDVAAVLQDANNLCLLALPTLDQGARTSNHG